MTDSDPLAPALERVRHRTRGDGAVSDVRVLLAAVEELVKAHRPVQLYQREDDCGHLEPENDLGDGWHDWDAGHPSGEDLVSGLDDYRICVALPLGDPACPGCTEIVQQATGDDTSDPVPASECLVRPLIARWLTGEENDGG
jgi:hypothetical protein